MQRFLAIAAGNSRSWSASEPAVSTRFMSMLGRFDPENLLLLSAIHDPTKILDKLPGSPESMPIIVFFSSILYPTMDEASAHSLGTILLRELEAKWFFKAGDYGLGWSPIRVGPGQLTSSLGAMFLDFCSGIETTT